MKQDGGGEGGGGGGSMNPKLDVNEIIKEGRIT